MTYSLLRAGVPCLFALALIACDQDATPEDPVTIPPDASESDVSQDVQQDDSGEDGSDDSDAVSDTSPDETAFPPVSSEPLSADTTRPAPVLLPEGFDNSTEVPLVISLHGYTGNGPQNAQYLKLAQNVTAKQFVLVTPNGTVDRFGNRFWKATDSCCGDEDSVVDDEAYLRGLIAEAKGRFNIDAGRVYLAGHSNGGFMSYRMACRASELVTGIFSFAGATYKKPSDCAPSQPVHVVQMHGTQDRVIQYEGGHPGGFTAIPQHPGAVETVTLWAGYNSCDATLSDSPTGDVSGASSYTMKVQEATGCAAGGSAQLWTMEGGVHTPSFPATLGPLILDTLFAHDRTP